MEVQKDLFYAIYNPNTKQYLVSEGNEDLEWTEDVSQANLRSTTMQLKQYVNITTKIVLIERTRIVKQIVKGAVVTIFYEVQTL